MISSHQHQTLLAARQHGGRFYAALAEAGLCADPLNRNRLFQAFPDLGKRYGPGSPFFEEVPLNPIAVVP